MAKKKKSSFALAAEKAAETPQDLTPPPNLYERKIQAAAEADTVVRAKARLVDPDDCVPEPEHDRLFENVTPEDAETQELIENLIAQGEGYNHMPAEVRPIPDPKPGGPIYEIVVGYRRWLAIKWLREHNYPQFKYHVKIKKMDDEEAFRISDLENSQKLDIAMYSRAKKYHRAMTRFYSGKQAELAKRLHKSEGWCSDLFLLLELPEEVVGAYAKLRDLKVHHTRPILNAIKDPAAKKRVIKAAKELKEVHAERAKNYQKPMPGSTVLKLLLATAKAPKKKRKAGPISTYGNFGAGPLIAVDAKNADRVKITLSLGSGATTTDAVNAFKQALADHYK